MNLEEKILDLIKEATADENITVATEFDSIFESLEYLEFIMELEDMFEVEISDEVSKNWTVIQDAIDYLNDD